MELAVVFVAMIVLLMGITQIWFWMNERIVKRQINYNKSRVASGTSVANYNLQWGNYRSRSLTQNEVLLGP